MIDAVVLLSGGKDSVYAAYIAQQQFFNIAATLTIAPSSQESMMFHVPNARFASVISSVMRLPNLLIEVQEHEDELEALTRGLKKLRPKTVITGALASDYQSQRINLTCEPLGIRVFSPLWHKNQKNLLREIVDAGFELVMVGASSEGLDENWLGRIINRDAVDELAAISRRHHIQVAGEGGEFETFVLDGPNFKKKLQIASSRKYWKRDSGFLKIDAVNLIPK